MNHMILLVSTSSQRSWWYFSLCSSPGILQDSGGCLAEIQEGLPWQKGALQCDAIWMPFGISPFCPNLSFTTIRHFEMFQHVNEFGILWWGQRMVSATGATTLRAAFWGENCKSFCRWNSASVVLTESWGPACRCQGGAALNDDFDLEATESWEFIATSALQTFLGSTGLECTRQLCYIGSSKLDMTLFTCHDSISKL